MVSIFFDLFNPNNRHRTEELRRLENTREDDAQGEPGRGPIDLNSGTVRIRVPGKQPAAAEDENAPQDAVPQDAVPDGTDPQDAVPEDPALEDAAFEGAAFEGTALWDAAPEGIAPYDAVPYDEDAAASGEENDGA